MKVSHVVTLWLHHSPILSSPHTHSIAAPFISIVRCYRVTQKVDIINNAEGLYLKTKLTIKIQCRNLRLSMVFQI